MITTTHQIGQVRAFVDALRDKLGVPTALGIERAVFDALTTSNCMIVCLPEPGGVEVSGNGGSWTIPWPIPWTGNQLEIAATDGAVVMVGFGTLDLDSVYDAAVKLLVAGQMSHQLAAVKRQASVDQHSRAHQLRRDYLQIVDDNAGNITPESLAQELVARGWRPAEEATS